MGCDIHLFVEYKIIPTDNFNWLSFGGEFRLWRDYSVFEKLAGVRGDVKNSVVKPRGLPDGISHETKNANLYFITEEPGHHYISSRKAKEWVRKGLSKYQDKNWVTNPDWHSHTWLTPDEFNGAITDAPVEYRAVLSALRCFEKVGFAARVVFWFDN